MFILPHSPAVRGLGKKLSFLTPMVPEVPKYYQLPCSLTQQALTQRSNKPTAKVLKTPRVILIGKGPWRSLGPIAALILSTGMTLTVLPGQASPSLAPCPKWGDRNTMRACAEGEPRAWYLFGGWRQVLLSLLLLHEDLLLHVLGVAGQAVGVEVVVALGLCESFSLLQRRKGSFKGFPSTGLCSLPR